MRVRLRRMLVVTQIAVSLVLLVAAGLFARSLVKLQRIDVGFNPESVLLLEVTAPAGERLLAVEERRALYRSLVERAATVPGVSAASASVSGLFSRGVLAQRRRRRGRRAATRCHAAKLCQHCLARLLRSDADESAAWPPFADTDRASTARVAIVNETFVSQILGGGDPVGRRAGLCSNVPCGRIGRTA